MVRRSHQKTLERTLGIIMLCAIFGCVNTPKKSRLVSENVVADATAINQAKENAGGGEDGLSSVKGLPTGDQLVEAKISALKAKLAEQDAALLIAEQKLAAEKHLADRTFDSNAYLELSIKNTAPNSEYRLEKTEIYVDGNRIARGGPRNKGLPRTSEIFFGRVAPGCHDITVKARYRRMKNDVMSLFKYDRVEHVTNSQAFIATNGYRVQIEIEGFEKQNTFFKLMRSPALRFNRSVRQNFLPGAAIVSMDDVLKQGNVFIDYFTEEASQHRLVEKSLSIDGLPILVAEKHDDKTDKTVIFNRPLSEGKHKLNVALLFAEHKNVGGGPLYNFRLKFDRDFYVISGQSTKIHLTGMPKNGFRSSPENTRYARVTSEISLPDNPEFFPTMTCKEKLAIDQKVAHALPVMPKIDAPSVPQDPPVVEEEPRPEILPTEIPQPKGE